MRAPLSCITAVTCAAKATQRWPLKSIHASRGAPGLDDTRHEPQDLYPSRGDEQAKVPPQGCPVVEGQGCSVEEGCVEDPGAHHPAEVSGPADHGTCTGSRLLGLTEKRMSETYKVGSFRLFQPLDSI